jgi:hypothetical protein
MMKVLHIGRHKTGTSALQHFLAQNAEAFAAKGLVYPRAMRAHIAHHDLAYLCNDRLLHHLPLKEQRRLHGELAQLQLETAAAPGWLLSSEAFQNIAPARVARTLGSMLGDRPSILVYLREPFAYLCSAYAQAIQNSKLTQSLAEYAHTRFRADYFSFLEAWESAFSQAQLVVRLFDPQRLPDGDIRRDFLEALGLPAGGFVFEPERRNPSIGGAVLDFKRRLNATAFESCIAPTRLYALLEQVAANEPTLNVAAPGDPDLRKTVQRQYAESNEAVRRRWFPGLHTLFASDDPATPPFVQGTAASPGSLKAVANVLDVLHGGPLGQALLRLLEGSGNA